MLDASRVSPEPPPAVDVSGPIDPGETSPYAWFLGTDAGPDASLPAAARDVIRAGIARAIIRPMTLGATPAPSSAIPQGFAAMSSPGSGSGLPSGLSEDLGQIAPAARGRTSPTPGGRAWSPTARRARPPG